MSAKRKHRTTNEYLKYLKGELSPEERYSFDRDLEADPFEMEAMEGMEEFTPGEVEEDLLSLHATLRKRLMRRRRRTIYSIAASVASLLIVGTVFINIYNFNPKSAEESFLNDETFLQEETSGQPETSAQEEESADRIILEEEDMEQEAPIEEDAPVNIDQAAPEEAPVLQEYQVREEPSAQEKVQDQEDDPDRVKATDQVDAQARKEIPVNEEDALRAMKAVSNEVVSDEVEAPAPVAEDVIVMEAQPKRSQKRDRAQKAPSASSIGSVGGIVVSSEDMEPLPGASIMVKGSDSGMVADMDGRFTLVADQPKQTTVIASYVGMETGEYQLAGGTENQVVMQPDMATLNEVVVIGYDADNEELIYRGAEPEGGLEAIKMYIEEQIRFPAGDTVSKREVVVLKFNVALDGTISHILTLRSPGDSFTEEAIRLLNDGPSWNPAQNESGATEDVVRMRIVFKR